MRTNRLDASALLLYFPALIAVFSLTHVGEQGEPFALALLTGMGCVGLPLFLPTAVYILSALSAGGVQLLTLYALQGLLLWGAFALKRKLFSAKEGGGFLPFCVLGAALVLFVFFSPFEPYPLPLGDFFQNGHTQKAFIAFAVFLCSAACAVGLHAFVEKFLKCRFHSEELIFLLLTYAIVGVGFCRFFGINAYMALAFFLLLLFCNITKDSTGMVCAFVLSLPALIAAGQPMQRFFVYGLACVAFSKHGKIAETLAFLAAFFFFAYQDGAYQFPTGVLLARLLSVVIPSLLFLLLPQALSIKLENELVFYREKHLSRLAINRNRAAIGDQLFQLSALFRDIQTAFLTLGNKDAEADAKLHVKATLLTSICKQCSGYGNCHAGGLDDCLSRLIDVGCVKGRASLIDLPAPLAATCGRQSDLLYALNAQLSEYMRYMLEAENAAIGRKLLAEQALGVSEIVKNIALEQSEPLPMYSQKERALAQELNKAGIVCSEILIYGNEESPTISLVTFGDAKVQKIAAVASQLFQKPLCAADKIALGKHKFCHILHKKPPYDAAFGLAHKTKQGEEFSGDTHSVVKIDEGRFLVALSDGMGSGSYAKRVSECTISLLESFYQSKMPRELILSTINRLLTFHQEETFACVDIAVVDLLQARADVVKIGAPAAFILSETTLQILESDSLPLGILECLRPTVASYQFRAGDTLLFLSDGVTDAFPSTGELYELLKTLPHGNPQQLANDVLAAALNAYGGVAKDDMTALAVKIFAAA